MSTITPKTAEKKSQKTNNQNIFVKNKNIITGFTLIELIIVVALIGTTLTVALPNLTFQSSTEVSSSLGRITSDVRSTYTETILSGKAHRLVFKLNSNQYWLEKTNAKHFYLGSDKESHDPTAEQITEKKQEFATQFQHYLDLAPPPVKDPNTDKDIPPVSPVLNAKKFLEGPTWTMVKSMDWDVRKISEILIIKSFQAQHLSEAVSVINNGEDIVGYIYFFPAGFVEKAAIHIYYRFGNNKFDHTKTPYTIVTLPNEGVAEVLNGDKKITFPNFGSIK